MGELRWEEQRRTALPATQLMGCLREVRDFALRSVRLPSADPIRRGLSSTGLQCASFAAGARGPRYGFVDPDNGQEAIYIRLGVHLQVSGDRAAQWLGTSGLGLRRLDVLLHVKNCPGSSLIRTCRTLRCSV